MSRAEAFNEWMRRYIDEPERYRREMSEIKEFLASEADGKTPDYGERCSAYLESIEAGN